MMILLTITKKKKQYYVRIMDTDTQRLTEQPANIHLLSQCKNIKVVSFESNKQNPLNDIIGEFAVEKLFVKTGEWEDRKKDFQILSIYYDQNIPCLYRSVDREGNITLHELSELDYTKHSLFGNCLSSLPSCVTHEPIENAYSYLKEIEMREWKDIPCRLMKLYLIHIKNFKEGYHTITCENNGTKIDIHEYMLYQGSASLKLIECIPRKKQYLTKQDPLVCPYPKERTVGFLSSTMFLLGNHYLLTLNQEKNRICFGSFDEKNLTLSLPFDFESLEVFERYYRGRRLLRTWHLNSKGSLPRELYALLLPNEFFKMPDHFYYEMNLKPYSTKFHLKKENKSIEEWMHLIAFYFCFQLYTLSLKKKLKVLFSQYEDLLQQALEHLITDLGPKDTLYVMKWTEHYLKERKDKIRGKEMEITEEDIENSHTLFTFFQNDYDLPDVLRIYSEEAICQYGGYEQLKSDYAAASTGKQVAILYALDRLEKEKREDHQKKKELSPA